MVCHLNYKYLPNMRGAHLQVGVPRLRLTERYMYVLLSEVVYDFWNPDSDVIGFLEGSEYPDEYVFVGNHRDSWVHGTLDPSSGTTTLFEVSEVFRKQVYIDACIKSRFFGV